jgi:hypothetical protein
MDTSIRLSGVSALLFSYVVYKAYNKKPENGVAYVLYFVKNITQKKLHRLESIYYNKTYKDKLTVVGGDDQLVYRKFITKRPFHLLNDSISYWNGIKYLYTPTNCVFTSIAIIKHIEHKTGNQIHEIYFISDMEKILKNISKLCIAIGIFISIDNQEFHGHVMLVVKDEKHSYRIDSSCCETLPIIRKTGYDYIDNLLKWIKEKDIKNLLTKWIKYSGPVNDDHIVCKNGDKITFHRFNISYALSYVSL